MQPHFWVEGYSWRVNNTTLLQRWKKEQVLVGIIVHKGMRGGEGKTCFGGENSCIHIGAGSSYP